MDRETVAIDDLRQPDFAPDHDSSGGKASSCFVTVDLTRRARSGTDEPDKLSDYALARQ